MTLRHSDSAHSSIPPPSPPPPSPPPPSPPLLLASVCRHHQSVEDVTAAEAARRPLSYSNASPGPLIIVVISIVIVIAIMFINILMFV